MRYQSPGVGAGSTEAAGNRTGWFDIMLADVYMLGAGGAQVPAMMV